MIHIPNTLRAAVLVAALGLAQSAFAATLPFEATMHISPDERAETVGTLPAGSSVTPILREDLAAAGLVEPPPGWIAIKHAVDVEGFVRNRDIGKDLAMKPDSPIFTEAAEDSPVLVMVGPQDPVETGDPIGRFSKATLRKEQVVYVNSVPPGSRAMLNPPSATAQQPTAPSAPAAAQAAEQPAAPSAPVAITAAPRTFEGYLMRTRRILGRGPKLDYQLVDEDNKRIALLDMSALLVTEPIEFFEGRLVRIYGPGLSMEGVNDAIIRVENLRLAR